MKKSISVLLFVAIVSNNLFGQDTVISTVANRFYDCDSFGGNYHPHEIFNQCIDFTFTKDSIVMGDMFNSTFKVIEFKGEEYGEQGKVVYYYCTDPEGVKCYILIKERSLSYKYPLVVIHYSDGAYFYYTK
jgi:hypothetical protein